MGAEQHPAYPEELGHLRRTLLEVEQQFIRLRGSTAFTREGEDLDEESMHARRAAEEALENRRVAAVWRLRVATQEPYFGRVDFAEDGQSEPESYYIGRSALEESGTGAPLVIDWRAPMASLFYTGATESDRAAYLAPAGPISGTLWLKRNLHIKRGVLKHIADSHIRGSGGESLVGDAYLLYALQESRDGRLRDIVATIQSEQNTIIRAPRDRPLIIQGAAGSGKTSVALHRLAYLLYTHRETMAPDRILILGPNRLFLDYIKDVLPELGVGGVEQTTFADWALAQLERRPELTDPSARLEQLFAPGHDPGTEPDAPSRYKGSLAFKAVLDQALAEFEAHFVPDAEVDIGTGTTLDPATLRDWFAQTYAGHPLNTRRKRVISRIKHWTRRQLELFRDADNERRLRLRAWQAVRRYSRAWRRHTALSLYREIMGDPPPPGHPPAPVGRPDLPPQVKESTLPYLRQGRVNPEDLAALVYLEERLNGIRESRQLDHVVIDEAQDFSPFQVELLRRLTRDNSMTILGDLAQGIFTHTGIRTWDELSGLFPAGSAAYHELPLSYRSTAPITRFASHLLARAGMKESAQPFFRAGPRVRMGQRVPGALIDPLVEEVRRLQRAHHHSIAVVGRTEAECATLQADLTAVGLRPRRVTARQDSYRGGLSVIPAYLTKGLEFDAVVVADAGHTAYQETPRDARLLYVVLTRALHELTVLYREEPSPLLAGMPAEVWEPLKRL